MKGGPRRAIWCAPKLLIMLLVHERFTCTRISAADIRLSRPFRFEKRERERERERERGTCMFGRQNYAHYFFSVSVFFSPFAVLRGREVYVNITSAISDTNINAGFVAVDSK